MSLCTNAHVPLLLCGYASWSRFPPGAFSHLAWMFPADCSPSSSQRTCRYISNAILCLNTHYAHVHSSTEGWHKYAVDREERRSIVRIPLHPWYPAAVCFCLRYNVDMLEFNPVKFCLNTLKQATVRKRIRCIYSAEAFSTKAVYQGADLVMAVDCASLIVCLFTDRGELCLHECRECRHSCYPHGPGSERQPCYLLLSRWQQIHFVQPVCSASVGLLCRAEPVASRDNSLDLNHKSSPALWHSFSLQGRAAY